MARHRLQSSSAERQAGELMGQMRSRATDSRTYPIDTGTARLIPDRDRPSAFLLLVNGVESSHNDLADPTHLEFEYLRWMATIIEARMPAGRRYEIVHLGGAGCSLARYLIATAPASTHLVVEIDARLAEYAREWFGLPRAPSLRIRVGDARTVVESLNDGSRDVVVRDVFSGAVTPPRLTTVEFTRQVHRILRPGGLYLLNCADSMSLEMARRESATVGACFRHTLIAADAPMLKGRRRGNIIIAGSDDPFDEKVAVNLLRDVAPAGCWNDVTVRAFGRRAAVLLDEDGATDR